MLDKLRSQYQVAKEVSRNGYFEGEIPLSNMNRIAEMLHLDFDAVNNPVTLKFEFLRDEFDLPQGRIYLDGNSLGPLSHAARLRAREVVDNQWGGDLIASWNKHHWIDLPLTIGNRLSPLLGAAPGQVVCCDSVSMVQRSPTRH